MVKKRVLTRLAFTLIELIFAIIIIAIAVTSLPLMTQVSSDAIEDSLAQEAIFAASQKLNLVLAYHWDDNSLVTGDTFASVININSECNATTKRKPGHINQVKHRKCNTNTATGVVLALDNYSLDDTNEALPVSVFTDTSSAHGYKQSYNSQVTVSNSGNPDLKQVDVVITLTDGTRVTTLSAIAANIGEVDYHHRTY